METLYSAQPEAFATPSTRRGVDDSALNNSPDRTEAPGSHSEASGSDPQQTNEFMVETLHDHTGEGASVSSAPEPLPSANKFPQTPSTSSCLPSPLDSPPLRTGLPRSSSYNCGSLLQSPVSEQNTIHAHDDIANVGPGEEEADFMQHRRHSESRSAYEPNSPEQEERERETVDKKGKKRESKLVEDSCNPINSFHESPSVEKTGYDFGQTIKEDLPSSQTDISNQILDDAAPLQGKGQGQHLRFQSLPHSTSTGTPKGLTIDLGLAKWSRLRSLLPTVTDRNESLPGGLATVTPQNVNITDELVSGGLSTLMLRLWFERDEKERRRIPILFHRLKIRLTDSVYPMDGQRAVFRIECEYADGAARWVIYRQLQDFMRLHSGYAISNAYNRNIDTMPDFPRASLPYFKFLKESQDDEVDQADFARKQREALENYLISLIRAVMFHPSVNRLASFLEISALAMSLVQSGGVQHKAGYLWIEAVRGKGKGFGHKSTSWIEKTQYRWCVAMESYLVVLDQPGELTIVDVFMLDSDFKIERIAWYQSKGLHLLNSDSDDEKESITDPGEKKSIEQTNGVATKMGSVSSRLSKIFRAGHLAKHHSEVPRTRNHSNPLLEPLSTATSPLDGPTDTDQLHDREEVLQNRAHADESEIPEKNKWGADVIKPTFYIENSQTRLKLVARSERQMLQWISTLEKVAATSHHTSSNRFDSFAPIRLNVSVKWLVDGRDYFWDVSRAILLARECIYIHDWWLSPELQLRRHSKDSSKDNYRIDDLLDRKAKEGVKIYIIVYQEVSNRTTPTDSNYTKQRMGALHPNIKVQRSPSHFQTGTFYWAHHEKLCIIDQNIAFMGGLDLCFGRWDTPQHVLVDDPDEQFETTKIWPGKDYSNGRVSGFVNLDKPDEDMHDRTKVPRMPWHDVGLQVVGSPARDLCRHFVQRWNYLLRIKSHSRLMPFLLPPPEFKPGELTEMGLSGTCEMQICRSAGPWSMGTPSRVEHSIQNAYLKAIQLSEHFVYIENPFFITSTFVNDVKIENRIGDALVSRIIRAHHGGTPWRCCVIIPLFPNSPLPVDHSDASAVRIVLEFQNRAIGRGPNSIFSRIRREGIDPDDYISFFSLRNWGKMRGDVLTTEQIYVHSKVCIVDDRLAIIGSANINERSQRGDRDSDIAAVIRDTDMIDGSMAGKPFKVARFAHTLRIRLMREHVGVDVDTISQADSPSNSYKHPYDQEAWDSDDEQQHGGNWSLPTPTPKINPQGFEDPISDSFWKKVWLACAAHNTAIYRKVFHAVPDDLITTWKQYREFVAYHDRLSKPTKDAGNSRPSVYIPSEAVDGSIPKSGRETFDSPSQPQTTTDDSGATKDTGAHRLPQEPKPFEKWERGEMEELLDELCGHLVIYPTRFLEGEDVANNLLSNADRLMPTPIYV